jgi:hypothetical protein
MNERRRLVRWVLKETRETREKRHVSFGKDSQALKCMSIRIRRDEYDKT